MLGLVLFNLPHCNLHHSQCPPPPPPAATAAAATPIFTNLGISRLLVMGEVGEGGEACNTCFLSWGQQKNAKGNVLVKYLCSVIICSEGLAGEG